MAKRIFQKIFWCPSKWIKSRLFILDIQWPIGFFLQPARSANKSPQNYAFCHWDQIPENTRCTAKRFSFHIAKPFFQLFSKFCKFYPSSWRCQDFGRHRKTNQPKGDPTPPFWGKSYQFMRLASLEGFDTGEKMKLHATGRPSYKPGGWVDLNKIMDQFHLFARRCI